MRLRWYLTAIMVCPGIGETGRSDDGPRSVKEQLAEIQERQKATFDRFHGDLEKAGRTDAAQQPVIDRFYEALRKNMVAALELARANPGDPSAFEALKFVIRTNKAGPGDATANALRMVLDHHHVKTAGQGPYLGYIALTLFQYPDAERVLRAVIAENPNRNDRGDGCYWLSRYLRQQARMVKKLREKPQEMKEYEKYKAAEPIAKLVREKNPENLEREAESLLEQVIANYGDVKTNDDPRPLAELAIGELFAIRRLDVGKNAPEIVGTDHHGKTLKLSEFRGKVVVLTFSGNWCGPCRGMYPQERELVAKLKDKPFALLSVNTDKELSTLQKSIESGEIIWRCWWDGGTDGPITTRWGVSGFPTVFVLDREGVIRFKDVHGDDLERAVSSLLDDRERNSIAPPSGTLSPVGSER